MKPERLIRALALAVAIALLITVTAMAVAALSGLIGVIALVGVLLAVLMTMRLLRRRVAGGTVLEIDFDKGVVETVGSDPVSQAVNRGANVLRDVVDSLKRAETDDRIIGMVARIGNGGIQLGHAQELRDSIKGFRDAGKRAIAYSESFGESGLATIDYYLACAFDQIYLLPAGQASIQGVLAQGRFLRGVFDNLDITPDFDHRMEYKSAKNMLTETGFTEPHREALGAVAGDQFSQVVSGIAADRNILESRVQELIDISPLMAREALDSGLVDHLGHRHQAYEAAKGEGSGLLYHDRYLKRTGRPHRKGARIALVFGTGSINRGSSRFDPLTRGPSMGGDDVARALRLATEDKKTKVIVFRVDSPGGSAVASEVIQHEVVRAKEAGKPVVVSMGNVAGSGGYWISANADRILAQPGTITGSIGVVGGKLATRDAWAKLGITFDEIRFGQNSTFSSSRDTYTDSERQRLQASLDAVYRDFTELVASGRQLEGDLVARIARGRIWSGARALEHGLVDALGGLNQAIDQAKELAGIGADQPVSVKVFPPRRALPIPETRESSAPVAELIGSVLDTLDGLRSINGAIQARVRD